MKRKDVTEIQHGDVLLDYRSGGQYEPIGTFGEYVPSPADPKIGEGMLKFTISTVQGTTHSVFYAPDSTVVVR